MGEGNVTTIISTPTTNYTKTVNIANQINTQQTLDIKAETLSERERLIIERLKGYRDLELEIEGCIVALHSSAEPPSVTIRTPDEDDPYVRAMYQEALTEEWEREIASTIEKHVHPKWRYVSVQRVNNALRAVKTGSENEALSIEYAIQATSRGTEERVELTPTERAIVRHEEMLERVRGKMGFLQRQKSVIETALNQMSRHYPEWHELLWRRYVRGEKYVTFIMEKNMSEKFYRNERHRALQKFDKLAVGLR